jgi:hypothetical protein
MKNYRLLEVADEAVPALQVVGEVVDVAMVRVADEAVVQVAAQVVEQVVPVVRQAAEPALAVARPVAAKVVVAGVGSEWDPAAAVSVRRVASRFPTHRVYRASNRYARIAGRH